MDTFQKIRAALTESKCEFFTHTLKSETPLKVTLSGLDVMDTNELKTHLVTGGLECTDIKIVTRQTKLGQFTFYIICIKRGSITLKELKLKFGVINKTMVKWDFHRKLPNKITQCHNCQMFGHGASNCSVKTFCAICSGQHSTATCKTQETPKCANCNGNHKSTDPQCPSRANYVEMRQKQRP